MKLPRVRVLALAGLATAPLANCAETTSWPEYALNGGLDPAGTIDAVVEIRSPGTPTFSLARDLTVRRVLAEGSPVTFRPAIRPFEVLYTRAGSGRGTP